MKITFGKFQGWDTLELAKAGEEGRQYLRWGKDNLQSPQWRKAFADALKADVHADEKLIYRALRVSYDDDEIQAMEDLAREQAADYESEKAYDDSLAKIRAKYSAILGVSEQKMRDLAFRYAFQHETLYEEKNFSSHQKFLDFDAFIKEYESVEYK